MFMSLHIHTASCIWSKVQIDFAIACYVQIFIWFADEAPPPTPLTESMEDTYITMTSATPSMVMCQETNKILGLSVEGAIMHVLRALEVGYY